jgi:hypothetical protein
MTRDSQSPAGLIEVLADEPDGGGTHDVGTAQDSALLASLRDFGRLSGEAQAAVRCQVGKDGSWRLVGWAERACTWAVRTRDRDVLAAAAAAASLHDPDQIDSRDALLVLALVSRACALVGATVGSVVERALAMTDEPGGAWLRDHLRPGTSLPPTHREGGAGSRFTFERIEPTGDPYVDLAHLLDDGPEALEVDS